MILCPWCGREDVQFERYLCDGWIECENCEARGPHNHLAENDVEASKRVAETHWNARALEHKEMGYMVVAGVNLYDFQGDVRKAIDDGWELLGGISVLPGSSADSPRYFQSMVKK